MPIVRGAINAETSALDAARLSAQASREAPDGRHFVIRLNDVEHRIWLKELCESELGVTIDRHKEIQFAFGDVDVEIAVGVFDEHASREISKNTTRAMRESAK